MSLTVVGGRNIGILTQPRVKYYYYCISSKTCGFGATFHRPWSLRRPTALLARRRRRSNHQLVSYSYSHADNIFSYSYETTEDDDDDDDDDDNQIKLGEWTLFTSPTPFNRFLKLRCPSLQSNDDKGPILQQQQQQQQQQEVVNEDVCLYQRLCINTEDGGVLSLDWPANLELTNDVLDTTILIIPGINTLGSMDDNVKLLVFECFLNRGCFPIVINPRGCAHSPLTTPRLFTAGDSDDISTAVHFINNARPWTTLMAIGLGYGANMLTKYLAQVGHNTPLIAATCLDNPFDLKAAAQSPHLTQGFIQILQSNKELFQSQSKGFDVEKALEAKSLEDFEEAISMVSYGFDSVDEFYASSSTRDMVGNVKIPVLFIQNHATPSFFIPHSSTADNPYISWLICSFLSDDKCTTVTSAVSWCQHLVAEWLTAVELGILKGRHPLLEDSNKTINPSKCLKLMASQASDANSKSNNLLNLHQLDENTSYPSELMLKRSDAYVYSRSGLDSRMPTIKDKNISGLVTQKNLVDSKVVKEMDVKLVDSETEKLVPATEVVMNMLDVTMSEALSEEQKHKVRTAVGQGETLMNALQDAVPEDVRGKLTSSVTAILENQKKALNASDVTSSLSSQEKEANASEFNKEDTTITEDSNNRPTKNDASELQAHTLGTNDSSQLQSASHHGGEVSNSVMTSDNHDADTLIEKTAQSSLIHGPDSSAPSTEERSGSFEDHISEQVKLGHEDEMKVEKDNHKKEDNDAQISTPKTEESSSSSPENQLVKKDGENLKKDESSAQVVPSNSSSNSQSFSVTQALDALTGMDDSTQVAVNSVFSVIEDVITQMEEKKDDASALGDKDKVEDTDTDPEIVSGLQQNEDGERKLTIEPKELVNHSISKLSVEKEDKTRVFNNNRDAISRHPYRSSLDSDAASDLFLDYVPEEGKWKLLEQSGNGRSFNDTIPHEGIDINVKSPLPSNVECNNDIIEPAYVILDDEGDCKSVREHEKIRTEEKPGIGDAASVVKENILISLVVECCRRIQATDMEDVAPMLRKELEDVANTISLAVVHDKRHIISWDGEKFVGLGNLQAEHIIDAISSAVRGTKYMKEVIPVGIVVDSSLASLRKMFNTTAADSIESTEVVVRDQGRDSQKGYQLQADRMVSDEMPLDDVNQNNDFYSENDEYEEKDVSSSLGNNTLMVGAVTAALGASSLFIHQQDSYSDGLKNSVASSLSFNQKENHQEDEEETSKSSDHNIVTSLAEKAMSVAAPVVPMKEDGEVDQERLVAMLTDLGQKGGILKLVSKVALLWGGLRGAISLIGKLFSFLRLSERPLFQRILGFVSMVLVLWTPVVVPLLPTLVQNWAAHSSSKMSEFACIIGLYSSIMVLVVLWGKRVRGYEDPLERYGLKLASASQIQNVVCGLIGGVMLVLLIQATNLLLGFICLSWPTIPSTDIVMLLKMFGQVLRYVGQGLVTTLAVVIVEELLFRSWLPEEIAADLGYNQGIILSGLAFSLSQWSLKAIPGLWLLSLGLTGVKQRCKGSLSVPIGLRAGILVSSFFTKESGFLIYQHTYPMWVSGGDPFQPFNGIVGLAVALLWAITLYPRKHQNAQDNIKLPEIECNENHVHSG